jgi:hypothetical protein
MDLVEIGWGGGLDWIGLAPDEDKWRALVNAVMKLPVGRKARGIESSKKTKT